MSFTILLATYNGENFLVQQLDSILNQSYQDWTCFIFDDCSADSTVKICRDYSKRHPSRFILHQNSTPTGSAKNNFISAINWVMKNNISTEYFAFCDQDDLWDTKKLEILYRNFLKRPKGIPLAVFSDLKVISSNGDLIHESFIEFISFNNTHYKDKYLLSVDNVIPGCSLAVNSQLLRMVDLNLNVIMHDWLLVLFACEYGEIIKVTDRLVEYRQHENNAVGLKRRTLWSHLRGIKLHIKKQKGIYDMSSRITKITPVKFAFYSIIVNVRKIFRT